MRYTTEDMEEMARIGEPQELSLRRISPKVSQTSRDRYANIDQSDRPPWFWPSTGRIDAKATGYEFKHLQTVGTAVLHRSWCACAVSLDAWDALWSPLFAVY